MNAIEAIVNEFVEFVNRQDRTRTIDHTSYESCALGNFLREELGVLPETDEFEAELYKLRLWLFANYRISNYIGNGGRYREMETYGGMADMLQREDYTVDIETDILWHENYYGV